MPVLDPRFVLMQPLQDYFVDKDTGEALSGGIVTFYVDNGPDSSTVLKPIYQLSLSPNNEYIYTELPNPSVLTSVGTFADDDGNDILPYLYPYTGSPSNPTGVVELYYITVESATGVEQFTRSAFPNVSSSPEPSDDDVSTNNQITNPQFVQVSFSPLTGSTFSVSGTTSTLIAPGWYIDTTGTGTITVSQLDLTDINIPTGPPFSLQISSTGLTGDVILRQRFEESPRLFSNSYVAANLVAASGDGVSHPLTLNYVNSVGETTLIANVLTVSNNQYTEFSGTSTLIEPTNNNPGSTGYIDIQLLIPKTSTVRVTSFQVVGVSNASTSVTYEQESTPRQLDHLFHYYKNSILILPKDSICVGWNFPLNPWQFSFRTLTNFPYSSGTIGYCADQTIIKTQNADSVMVGRASSGFDEGNMLQIQARSGVTQGKIAVIQYLSAESSLPYFNSKLSALVRARIQPGGSSSLQIKMRIITSATAPIAINVNNPIIGWSGTDPTFQGQWTSIAPVNDPVYTINSSTNIQDNYFAFNGFQMPTYSTERYIGIVFYTINTLNNVTPDSLLIKEIAVTPNEFALDPSPKTYDQVYRECEYYYEKTYDDVNIVNPTTGVGATTLTGSLFSEMGIRGSATVNFYALGFKSQYRTLKCKAPTLHFYSPVTGAVDNARRYTFYNATSADAEIALSNWTTTASTKSFTSLNNNSYADILITVGITTNQESYIRYHYTADARLGL